MFGLWNGVEKVERLQAESPFSKLHVPFPFWTDLKTFPFEEFYGLVDLYSAGFPCQPFSLAGVGAADNDPRHLFPFIKRGISKMRPRIVFLENVEGIISAKLKGSGLADPAGTPVLLHVLRELERLGYRPTAGIFSASEVGLPHQRKRVFVLAVAGQPGLESCGSYFIRSIQEAERALSTASRSGSALFPSRPGEPQYEWEPPRTVANPRSPEQHRLSHFQREENSKVRLSGIGVADSERPERRQDPRSEGSSEQGNTARRNESAGRTGECGSLMANPENANGGGEHQESRTGSGRGGSSGGSSMADALRSGGELHRDDQRMGRQSQSASEQSEKSQSQVKSPVCRASHGNSDWLDYADLCHSHDSRIDELRACGNGVVPATAAKAFVTLFNNLWWE